MYGSAGGSLFGMSGIGLVAGMLLYLLASLILRGRETTGTTLGRHGAREK